jgi:hypothetical protein
MATLTALGRSIYGRHRSGIVRGEADAGGEAERFRETIGRA